MLAAGPVRNPCGTEVYSV